uniref:Uncharacterized protein n=1 Tax=Cacopsylla melanoneura TaxID=428564 RepID=A0A8D8LZI8_9HEMI
MTDNLDTYYDRSFRNHCDIRFLKENFRFREKPPARTPVWKIISFTMFVIMFFLVNLTIRRIQGVKIKYTKNVVDSFIFGFHEFDRRSCAEEKFQNKTKSVYWVFKTLSNDFHRIPDKFVIKSKSKRVIAQENGSDRAMEREPRKPGSNPNIKMKKGDTSVEKYNEYILPVMIILLLVILTAKTVWDAVGNMALPKKKPSFTSVSRRPSLRQNLYRKMSETNSSAGIRRTSVYRQNSQPDIRRKLSFMKDSLHLPSDLTRQFSAPASYVGGLDTLRRSHAIDNSSEDDPMTPETKRRVRMLRRF